LAHHQAKREKHEESMMDHFQLWGDLLNKNKRYK
jgi:hypothetical protein